MTIARLASPLLVILAACGDSGAHGSISDSASQGPTAGPTSATQDPPTTGVTDGPTGGLSSGTGSASDGAATVEPTDGVASSGGPKFDLGVQLDGGAPGCGDSGGEPATMFSYIWIANSGEGTVSKINTRTGVEEGRYLVEGGSPSRTSVNLQGDVAVSARDPGGVTKIAAITERCVDLNGDGQISTSTGPADIKPKGADECVLWFKPIPSPSYTNGPRATAWEGVEVDPVTCAAPTPRLWFGWMDANSIAHFMRVDGSTGATLDEITHPWQSGDGYAPYGGAVNAKGDFFVTGLNQGPTIKIDAETLEISDFGGPGDCKYGMTLDADGNIWAGGCFSGTLFVYDIQLAQWFNTGSPGGSRVNGVSADRDGNVWGAGTAPCRLVHVDAATRTVVNPNVPLPGCLSPWGVSVDIDGFVWVVDRDANLAFKVDPDTYEVMLTVGGLVAPYTYSDMTGAGLNLQVNPPT